MVREGPASVEVVVEHFAHRDARLIVPDGTAFGIAAHQELHKRFLDERHTLGDFEAVFERLLDIVG